MKEIQSVVNAQVLSMCESGEIQRSVEEGVKSAINKAIEKQFESWGNITKQIEKIFDDNLKVDTSQLDIPCYNKVMMMAVNQKINEFFLDGAGEKLLAGIEDKLSPLPKEMHIKDFVNKICEMWRTDEPWDASDLDFYATVEFVVEDSGYANLKMWKQKDSTGYRSHGRTEDVHLYIGKDGEIRLRHAWNPTTLFDADGFIFKAYSSGMVLTGFDGFDAEDDCDLMIKSEDY